MFNKATKICCARELRPRFSKYERGSVNKAKAMSRMSCCNQYAYDTKHEICCGLRVCHLVNYLNYFNGIFVALFFLAVGYFFLGKNRVRN